MNNFILELFVDSYGVLVDLQQSDIGLKIYIFYKRYIPIADKLWGAILRNGGMGVVGLEIKVVVYLSLAMGTLYVTPAETCFIHSSSETLSLFSLFLF